MAKRTYRTSDMAQAGRVHSNTVRLYEELGYLPPVPRNPRNNYREFSAQHLDQIRLIRMALHVSWLSGIIGKTAVAVITLAAAGDFVAMLENAHHLAALIMAEQDQAEAAVSALEHWALNPPPATRIQPLTIGQTARLLEVTIDMLRNWERNGLITDIPRAPNGYRQYGPREIARLRVIRTLRRARYSTMSILRMLLYLDAGHTDGLREKLDTPDPDDDVFYATDSWLTTLADMVHTVTELVTHAQSMAETYG